MAGELLITRELQVIFDQSDIKFIYSEKATKFCEIFTLLLSYVVPVKSKLKILQNFVAFSEYMNFKNKIKFDVHFVAGNFKSFVLFFV